MLTLTKIEPPPWAPVHARHVIELDGELGEEAKQAFEPHLDALYVELHARLNTFVNDSQQCFASEEEGFPVHDRLDGTYYIGSETYVGEPGEPPQLWLFVRLPEKPWHANQDNTGYDYLGLEVIVTLESGGKPVFDTGFNSSVI